MSDSSQYHTRNQRIRSVLWFVFALNLSVAAAKFFYGLASGSAAMQADGIHSVFDSLGNVIGLVGIAFASKPADSSHPYGHAKFETYGSAAIGFLLIAAAIEVAFGAVSRLISQEYVATVTPISFFVMIATLVVNLLITSFERRQGKKLHSQILSADAAHTLSDVFVSLGVLISLGFVSAGFPMADPVMALIVVVFILISAVSVFRSVFRTLSDHACLDSAKLKQTALTIEGVKEAHNIRTRGTESEVYCDMHILVNPDMTVRDAHHLGDEVESRLVMQFPEIKEVLVHIEPFGCEESDDDKIELD